MRNCDRKIIFHLSLGLLCHKSNNHFCVWQDTFDEVELFFPDNLDRLDQNSTQEIHQHCTLQLSLSKCFRIDEKVNTIDDSNRDIFSILFLSDRVKIYQKSFVPHCIYLTSLY